MMDVVWLSQFSIRDFYVVNVIHYLCINYFKYQLVTS